MLTYERAMNEDYSMLSEIIREAFRDEMRAFDSVHALCKSPDLILEYIESRRVWKIILDDMVIGCSVVHIQKVGFGTLDFIAISPKFQNKGYGSETMRWIESQYRSVYVWESKINTMNAGVSRFFERNGYIRIDSGDGAIHLKKDLNQKTSDPNGGCLYRDLPELGYKEEYFEDLITVQNVRTERIISRGQITPSDFCYDQDWTEIVLVVAGNAVLDIEGQIIELRAGDWRCIHPHQKHRVIKTSQNPPCVWYAIHIQDAGRMK